MKLKTDNINQINRINALSDSGRINDENAEPKELFLNAWQIIKSNYYDSTLNRQNWAKWKKRYLNQHL